MENNKRFIFDNFEQIAMTATHILPQPKSKTFDFSIDQNVYHSFRFQIRYTGYAEFTFNKVAMYKNVKVLHPYYMRNSVLIFPFNDVIYIGQRDYDLLKNGQRLTLFVKQIGDDPYARLNVDLFITNPIGGKDFEYPLGLTIKHRLFEETKIGEFDFYKAVSVNSVATNTKQTHTFLYKYCNLDRQIINQIECSYVYWTDGKKSFMIDGDDIETGDDPEITFFSDRVRHVKQYGIDPIQLQLIQQDGLWHLRIWPGSYISWLDWIIVHLCDFDQIPACIIIGNTQYNEHQYDWKPISTQLVNEILAPEFSVID